MLLFLTKNKHLAEICSMRNLVKIWRVVSLEDDVMPLAQAVVVPGGSVQ